MKISLHTQSVKEVPVETLIIPIFEEESCESSDLKLIDEMTSGALSNSLGNNEMKGKLGDIVSLYISTFSFVKKLLLVGAGKEDKNSISQFRQSVGQAARSISKKGVTSLAVLLRGQLEDSIKSRAAVEGVILGFYDTAIYKTAKNEKPIIESLVLCTPTQSIKAVEKGIELGQILGRATNFARSLSVEPGNKLTPKEMARRSEEMAKDCSLQFEVIGPDKMKELGMGAILGVSAGSDEPPQLIIVKYIPSSNPSQKRIALVGKGITFDSGGICIKGRESMWEMKYDMSGGAAVLGAMQAIAVTKPNVEVIGIVAASENLLSGKAYKPGDVLHSYDGKTIEVIDTDAEGRLVLADALTYAIKQKATHIIDLATLTGAIVIALGTERAGLMGTCPELISDIQSASDIAGEKFWQLPLDEEYSELMKSDIADIKNLGGKYAGSITAAAFLQEFVGDTPWVHLDIAGTAWLEKDKAEIAKGPSGFGVRTLVHLVNLMADK